MVVSITHYFPLPFLAFHSVFSVFRSCLAFCLSLKIKPIKNLCLLNILLFKKEIASAFPFIFFYVVKEYFPFSSFKFSDLKHTQRHYFIRKIPSKHGAANGKILFCFVYDILFCLVFHCIHVPLFFIHLPVDGHLGCIQFFTIINNTAINIWMYVYFLNRA